jgi:hypothetical protein
VNGNITGKPGRALSLTKIAARTTTTTGSPPTTPASLATTKSADSGAH